MRIRLSLQAAEYPRSEAKYLRAPSPKAARDFLAVIQEARRNLLRFPDFGNDWRSLPIPGARTLVAGDYLLDYVCSDDLIEVISIRHGRQHPLVPDPDADDG